MINDWFCKNVQTSKEQSIESSYSPTFGVGIQWHAEFHPEKDENYLNKVLFQKFGESCWAYRAKK